MPKIPNIHVPRYITTSAVQAVRAAIDDAVRLGLTWRLRPGTVGGSGPASPESVPVRIDGDSRTVRVRSMIGAVGAGQRVWCIQVPPAGIYILGIVGASVQTPLTQTFTSSGTWTKLPGLSYVDVIGCGGGGGSGGAPATAAGEASMGGGGGGGATFRARIPAALLPPTVTVSIGAGGTAGAATSGVSAGSGGQTSFGTLITANGGTGGVARAASAIMHGTEGGNGSNTIGGTVTGILHSGTAGTPGWGGNNGLGISGTGGASHLGGGGRGQRTASAGQGLGGLVGRLYGGGAGGSINSGGASARTGAAGAAGVVIVEEFYSLS